MKQLTWRLNDKKRRSEFCFLNIEFSFLPFVFCIAAALLVLPSCNGGPKKSQKYPGYFETEEGVNYRIHVVGESGKKPQENDWLELEMINVVGDSTIYDSQLDNPRGTILMPFSGNKYFEVLSEGDSATFILPAGGLFEYNYDSAAQFMHMNVKLEHILSAAEAEKINTAASRDPELDEQKMIAIYLRKKKITARPGTDGLYFMPLTEGTGPAPEAGKTVTVSYYGTFLNGQPFDDPGHPVEFSWGAERQMLKGLEAAVSRMKSGGVANVILPSQLAFGKEGSGDGRVKPYTPVVYHVEIIEVK